MLLNTTIIIKYKHLNTTINDSNFITLPFNKIPIVYCTFLLVTKWKKNVIKIYLAFQMHKAQYYVNVKKNN